MGEMRAVAKTILPYGFDPMSNLDKIEGNDSRKPVREVVSQFHLQCNDGMKP